MIDLITENRFFTYALCCSLGIHLAVLIVLLVTKGELAQKPLNKLEVTYQKISKSSVPQVPKKEFNVGKKTLPTEKKPRPEMRAGNTAGPVGGKVKDISRLTDEFGLDKKKAPSIKPKERTHKVSVPVIEAEKITNPKYLSYNETIRQKIKTRAYSYVDHPDFRAGEVYITFRLGADGSLNEVKVIESRTFANEYLRSVGMRSVRESSPFLAFPKDLAYPELTFNVVISFEVTESK